MRKFLIVLCCIIGSVMILSLNGCSSENSFDTTNSPPETTETAVEVVLDSANFEDYIILNVKLDDITEETKRGLFGTEYRGEAKLIASASLRKDVEVDSVKIKGRIMTDGLGWALKVYEFTLELNKDGEAEYSETIYSGDYGLIRPELPIIMNKKSLESILSLANDEFTVESNQKAVAVSVTGKIYE